MASKHNSGLIVILLIILLLKIEGIALSDEKRLITHLLGNYSEVGVVGRPVYNISDTIVVQYGLALIQILDLDEKNQVLTTNCWGRYMEKIGGVVVDDSLFSSFKQWHDILLKWDPDEYGGVDLVRVPTERIWTPDIVLYNYADTRREEKREALAVVQHDGRVLWIPRAIFKSTCKINIIHFPFDKQKCKLKFGSWTYDGFKLDIDFFGNEPKVDLTDYVPSNEWIVLDSPAKKNIKRYPCCIEPYPDVTFEIVIQRQPAFYRYILILPCVLLSSLTLVLFWLPPESPAKMVLGMNIFVAFFVLLLLLADVTPPASSAIPMIGMNIFVAFFLLLILLADVTPPAASELPQIGAYYCLNMGMITLSTFLSVIVINLYFRGDRRNKVPWWLRKIMLGFFARLFCMRRDTALARNLIKQPRIEGVKMDGKGKGKNVKCPELKYNKFQMYDVFRDGVSGNQNNESTSPDKSPIHLSHSLESDVKEIRRTLRILLGRIQEKDNVNKIAMEWRAVALVLDRLFFFIYLTAIITSLATIFPKAR